MASTLRQFVGTHTTNGQSLAVTLTVSPGDLLVAVAVIADNAGASTISTITGGGTWQRAITYNPFDSVGGEEIWYCYPESGTTTITATLNEADSWDLMILDFRAGTTFDKANSNSGASATVSTATTTLAGGGEVLVAVGHCVNARTGGPTNGFTTVPLDSNSSFRFCAYKINAPTDSSASGTSWTVSGSGAWHALFASFAGDISFIGPVQLFQYPTGSRLLDRLRPQRGVTVYSTDGGGTWKQSVYPYQGDIGNVDLNGIPSQYVDGRDYFLGGHVYSLSSAQATALTAAGFGAYIF